MKRHVDEAVGAAARRQHGVFSDDQAAEAGASPGLRKRRVKAGIWVPVTANVHRPREAPVTWRSQLHAAQLDAGPRSLVTMASSAQLYQYPGYRSNAVEMLVPRGMDHVCEIAVIHETRRFDAVPVREVDGLRVVSPEATLFFLAARLRVGRLGWLTDELLMGGSVDYDRLVAVHDALAGRGVPGSGVFRRVLDTREPRWHPGQRTGAALHPEGEAVRVPGRRS